MPATLPTRRRWFQFGLGTMLLVITALAVGLGWELNFVRARRAFDMRARAEGAGYAFPASASLSASWPEAMRDGEYETRWPPRVPMWREWLGDQPYGLVMVPDAWPKKEAANVERLFPESFVFWRGKRLLAAEGAAPR
ncbi:MAG TPA: hypothetical protein VGG64_14625 [Pirellulales bacterium]|jgi:hypothetical protein